MCAHPFFFLFCSSPPGLPLPPSISHFLSNGEEKAHGDADSLGFDPLGKAAAAICIETTLPMKMY